MIHLYAPFPVDVEHPDILIDLEHSDDVPKRTGHPHADEGRCAVGPADVHFFVRVDHREELRDDPDSPREVVFPNASGIDHPAPVHPTPPGNRERAVEYRLRFLVIGRPILEEAARLPCELQGSETTLHRLA